MTRRTTIRNLMAAIAGVAVVLGSFRAGERAERFARPRPVMVHVTRSGSRYHREGCRYVRGGAVPTPLDEARGSRYRPCSICRPPR
jgi:hypothetical protein